MIGVVINKITDTYYIPTIKSLFNEDLTVLTKINLPNYEQNLIESIYTRKRATIDKLVLTKDNSLELITSSGVQRISFSAYDVVPQSKLSVVLFEYKSPKISGISLEYEFLQSILESKGALFLSEFIEENNVANYSFSKLQYPNELLVTNNPIEFILIQNGLNRLDKQLSYESEKFQLEYNSECWERYLVDKIEIYEPDFISRGCM